MGVGLQQPEAAAPYGDQDSPDASAAILGYGRRLVGGAQKQGQAAVDAASAYANRIAGGAQKQAQLVYDAARKRWFNPTTGAYVGSPDLDVDAPKSGALNAAAGNPADVVGSPAAQILKGAGINVPAPMADADYDRGASTPMPPPASPDATAAILGYGHRVAGGLDKRSPHTGDAIFDTAGAVYNRGAELADQAAQAVPQAATDAQAWLAQHPGYDPAAAMSRWGDRLAKSNDKYHTLDNAGAAVRSLIPTSGAPDITLPQAPERAAQAAPPPSDQVYRPTLLDRVSDWITPDSAARPSYTHTISGKPMGPAVAPAQAATPQPAQAATTPNGVLTDKFISDYIQAKHKPTPPAGGPQVAPALAQLPAPSNPAGTFNKSPGFDGFMQRHILPTPTGSDDFIPITGSRNGARPTMTSDSQGAIVGALGAKAMADGSGGPAGSYNKNYDPDETHDTDDNLSPLGALHKSARGYRTPPGPLNVARENDPKDANAARIKAATEQLRSTPPVTTSSIVQQYYGAPAGAGLPPAMSPLPATSPPQSLAPRTPVAPTSTSAPQPAAEPFGKPAAPTPSGGNALPSGGNEGSSNVNVPLLQFAAGIGAPTRTGGFSEALSNGMSAAGKTLEEQRQQDIANRRADIESNRAQAMQEHYLRNDASLGDYRTGTIDEKRRADLAKESTLAERTRIMQQNSATRGQLASIMGDKTDAYIDHLNAINKMPIMMNGNLQEYDRNTGELTQVGSGAALASGSNGSLTQNAALATLTKQQGSFGPGSPDYIRIQKQIDAIMAGANRQQPAAGQAPAQSGLLPAPTDPSQRKVGQPYSTPKGNYTWTGTGWVPAGGQ